MTVSRIRYIQKLLIALCACVLFFYAPTQVYAAIDDNSSSSVCGQSPDTPSEVNPGITIGQYKKWCLDSYKDLSKFAPNPWDDGACKCTPKPIITLNTAIPGFTSTNAKGQIFFAGGLPAYIVGVYKFFIGASVIISLVMIMIAGFQWTLAGGIAGKIETAKDRIKSAVAGLLLGLFSYSILFFVNPALVDFGVLNLTAIPGILSGENKTRWPIDTPVITQLFGPAKCKFVGLYLCSTQGQHMGIDLWSDKTKGEGVPVYAVASGTVRRSISPSQLSGVGPDGFGCSVAIEHDENLKGTFTYYAHLKGEPKVVVGEQVKAGDLIGYMGGNKNSSDATEVTCAGTSAGTHLHFEVRKGISNVNEGKDLAHRVDPLTILPSPQDAKAKCDSTMSCETGNYRNAREPEKVGNQCPEFTQDSTQRPACSVSS